MAARKKNRGLIYIRRSSGRQELSLGGQLTWAIERARQEGVLVDASLEDLDFMQRRGLSSYKDIRLDDSISGADMLRPGFLATQTDVLADRRISHFFVHMRDRFGRPEDALPMIAIEKSIRKSGVTIILSNGLGLPMEQGEVDLGEDLKLMVEYYMSGDFLRKLSERVIDAHRQIATLGCWTGGNAPYGCTRVLVDAKGNVLEELLPGRTVKQSGCHVQIRPKDENKIKWWILMLDLSRSKWGSKRIANLLNDLGVPSPNAGRIRKDRGVPHVLDGKWSHRTVLDLLRNPTVIGQQRYGRRSMGSHRRLAAAGHRVLTETDRTEEGKGALRIIHNDPSIQIRTRSGFTPAYDPEQWQTVQEGIDARGRPQKGIPKVHDLSKYPLACRIIDMTDDCGSFLYARTSGLRRLYCCGRYMKSGASACGNNTVDGEAMLTFVMRCVERVAAQPGVEDRLRAILEAKLQSASRVPAVDQREMEKSMAAAKRAELIEQQSVLAQNMRRLVSDKLLRQLEEDFEALSEQIQELDDKLAAPQTAPKPVRSVDEEVQSALAKLEWLRQVAGDPTARAQLPKAISELGVRAGLVFQTKQKGKRKVQALRGGVLVFRDAQLPIELYGRDRVHKHEGGEVSPIDTPPAPKFEPGSIATEQSLMARNPAHHQKEKAEGVETPSACETGMDTRPKEGFSSTMVSRGDRI